MRILLIIAFTAVLLAISAHLAAAETYQKLYTKTYSNAKCEGTPTLISSYVIGGCKARRLISTSGISSVYEHHTSTCDGKIATIVKYGASDSTCSGGSSTYKYNVNTCTPDGNGQSVYAYCNAAAIATTVVLVVMTLLAMIM